jgi:hypothetical protein
MLSDNMDLLHRPVQGTGFTPLYCAAHAGHLDIVRYLLEKGAKDDEHRTAFLAALTPSIRHILKQYHDGTVNTQRQGSGRKVFHELYSKLSSRKKREDLNIGPLVTFKIRYKTTTKIQNNQVTCHVLLLLLRWKSFVRQYLGDLDSIIPTMEKLKTQPLVITLDQVRPVVFDAIMKFLYTGDVPRFPIDEEKLDKDSKKENVLDTWEYNMDDDKTILDELREAAELLGITELVEAIEQLYTRRQIMFQVSEDSKARIEELVRQRTLKSRKLKQEISAIRKEEERDEHEQLLRLRKEREKIAQTQPIAYSKGKPKQQAFKGKMEQGTAHKPLYQMRWRKIELEKEREIDEEFSKLHAMEIERVKTEKASLTEQFRACLDSVYLSHIEKAFHVERTDMLPDEIEDVEEQARICAIRCTHTLRMAAVAYSEGDDERAKHSEEVSTDEEPLTPITPLHLDDTPQCVVYVHKDLIHAKVEYLRMAMTNLAFTDAREMDEQMDKIRLFKMYNCTDYTMTQLIRYIYTGVCQVKNDTAVEMLFLGMRCELYQLKAQCEKYIIDHMEEFSNIADVIMVSDVVNSSTMYNHAIKVMAAKYRNLLEERVQCGQDRLATEKEIIKELEELELRPQDVKEVCRRIINRSL